MSCNEYFWPGIQAERVALPVQYLNASTVAIQHENMSMIDRNIRRLIECCSCSAAIAQPTDSFQNIAIEIKNKNEITWSIGEIEVPSLRVDSNTRGSGILRFAPIVPNVAHEVSIVIEHDHHASFCIGNIDVVSGIDGHTVRLAQPPILPTYDAESSLALGVENVNAVCGRIADNKPLEGVGDDMLGGMEHTRMPIDIRQEAISCLGQS